ncbi:MAG: thiamine ABC transporter substrate-binding protein [Oligoflexia bacterium]|nr:thiamine ABC transporter substrate-binding protein [Oligoflexia bacterium]
MRPWLAAVLALLSVAGWGVRASLASPVLLTIYAYDSFAAPGGLGPEIIPKFEKKCGCQVRLLASGDGSQLISRLALDAERGKSGAQIVIGLDGPAAQRARGYIDSSVGGSGREELAPEVKAAGLPAGFVPYDFGYFAFMADRDQLKRQNLKLPARFSDLLRPEWRRNLILEDPRTSTPGLAFALYADTLGADWSKLRAQWLTLAPGWDGAYGLFLKAEAPLVWSYTTSQAYHQEHGDRSGRYQAVIFEEGQPIQVEAAALVKNSFNGPEGARQRALAQSFLEFLLSKEVQALLPTRNWMYPARKGVALPASFEGVPKPARVIRLEADPEKIKASLNQWTRTVQ